MPVGSYPPNPRGLYDMAGNVREWCLDGYDPQAYWWTPDRDPHAAMKGFWNYGTPTGAKEVQRYVVRGGAFTSPASACGPGARDFVDIEEAAPARNVLRTGIETPEPEIDVYDVRQMLSLGYR